MPLQSTAGLFIITGLFCGASAGLAANALHPETFRKKGKSYMYRRWETYMGCNPLSGNTNMGSFPPMPSEGKKLVRWRDIVRKREGEAEPPADWEPSELSSDETHAWGAGGLGMGALKYRRPENPFRPFMSNISKYEKSSFHKYYGTLDTSEARRPAQEEYYKDCYVRNYNKNRELQEVGEDPAGRASFLDLVLGSRELKYNKKYEKMQAKAREQVKARTERNKMWNELSGETQEPIFDRATGKRLATGPVGVPKSTFQRGILLNGRDRRPENI